MEPSKRKNKQQQKSDCFDSFFLGQKKKKKIVAAYKWERIAACLYLRETEYFMA